MSSVRAIAQITDAGVYNHAGPEFGVASTKIYTSQLVILTLMALLIGRYQGVSFTEGSDVHPGHQEAARARSRRSSPTSRASRASPRHTPRYQDFLFIGRLYNYPTAMEGALKLKEISYIHAEGYPAGEMKHGPISLIDENFPTVAIVPQDSHLRQDVSATSRRSRPAAAGCWPSPARAAAASATCATTSSACPKPCRSCSRC